MFGWGNLYFSDDSVSFEVSSEGGFQPLTGRVRCRSLYEFIRKHTIIKNIKP